MPMEYEAKLKVDDLESIKKLLHLAGASYEGICLEKNWVMDDKNNSLFAQKVLLRVRNLGSVGGILTVKHPPVAGEFKTREEIESMVDSTDDLLTQLAIIGFHPAWIYEKYRETWLWQDCVLALDECPEIGSFIEIEGIPERIRKVATDLGLDYSEHIDGSYLDLWKRHLDFLNQPPRHMLFTGYDAEQKRRAAGIPYPTRSS